MLQASKNPVIFEIFNWKSPKNGEILPPAEPCSPRAHPPGSLDESPTLAPTMGVWCVLTHPLHPLSQAIFAKAALEGVKFVAEPPACVELRQRHAAVLAAFPDALEARTHDEVTTLNRYDARIFQLLIGKRGEPIMTPPSRLLRIMNGHLEHDSEAAGVTLCIHDVLPPAPGSELEQMFREWMEASRSQTTPNLTEQQHHWCDVSDVSAMVTAILRDSFSDGTYHASGRRGWTTAETWREFDALVQRTIAGQTGSFGTEHLVASGVPAVGAVPIKDHENRRTRPDLGPLHAELMRVNGEGWRPKTPLRQSLMMVIAQLSERQST